MIGEKPFLAIFLQSKSGYEEIIIQELKNKILNLNFKYLKILKCFGHFDIAILFNLDKLDINLVSFERICQQISQIDYITDSNYIVGYSWEENIDFKGMDFCWGVSSIKLALNDYTINPIKTEKEVIKKIIEISNKTDIKIKVFGGLGWNEIILIINSPSLKEISKFVYAIRIFDEILDISTIPAIIWGCWNTKKLEMVPNCQILITHRSRIDYPIRELLLLLADEHKINIYKNHQEDIGLIFGGFDIRLPIVNSELNNIVKFVLEVRKITTITKTNTIFSPMQIPPANTNLSQINISDYSVDLKTINVNRNNKNIEIPTCDELICILENEIRHLHNEYLELKNDFYTKSLYSNLESLFENLGSNINRVKELNFEINYNASKIFDQKRRRVILLEQLKKVIQSLEFSIYQRISGMQMSYLMESKHTGFEKFGGIQRIILAIEAIPREIINRTSQKNWSGFCVFGSEPDFICQNIGEVISIPFEYKYMPEKWWGLGHEIGHILINRYRDQIVTPYKKIVRDNFDNDIEKFQDNLKRTNAYDEELFDEYKNREFELINENIEEMCADYLNFKIVFFSDWKSFLNCTLNYLDSRGYDILSETRLFRVISISEHINKGSVEKDRELFTTIKKIRNFSKYDEIHFKDRINIIRNQTFYPYFKIVERILNNIDAILNIDMNADNLKAIDTKLNKGEIIESNTDSNTIYILKSLINRDLKNDINFRYQITSILSLYNSQFSK